MSDKKYLTPIEVAAILMVSPITVRQWAQKGLLEATFTAGGHRRFAFEVVQTFARERGIDLPTPREADSVPVRDCLLVVDDNRLFNKYLVALFTDQVPNLPIFSAFDGFEAGRAVQAHAPSVILLDIMMPHIDGLEVCRSLKSDPETASIRVVAMTGYPTPELEKKMLAEGAHVLLRKPFPNEVVVRECGFTQQVGLHKEIAKLEDDYVR